MKNKQRRPSVSLAGFLSFFFLICVITTIVVLVSTWIQWRTNQEWLTALLCAIVIIFLALVCTITDSIRRRYSVDIEVEEIADATAKISRGEFSIRLNSRHKKQKFNEFDKIKQNINTMAKALSENEVLKSDFISNLSHEIKTPLTIIQNCSAVLSCSNTTQEKRAETLEILNTTTQKISGLVSNILKLNKLEHQALEIFATQIQAGEFLREEIIGWLPKLEEKQLNLNLDIDDFTFKTDTTLFNIITSNLISNAIKFCNECGKIYVSLKKSKDFIILEVADTGVGLTKEECARVFDKFYQADTSHKTEGNGLGLSLVKKAVVALAGEITVSSEKNKGARFTVKLKTEDKNE